MSATIGGGILEGDKVTNRKYFTSFILITYSVISGHEITIQKFGASAPALFSPHKARILFIHKMRGYCS